MFSEKPNTESDGNSVRIQSGSARASEDHDPDLATQAELENSDRQALTKITRELCEGGEFPQLLFFTDYGNRHAVAQDTYSDLDIRCVYIGVIPAAERKTIETQIQRKLFTQTLRNRPIELKFQGLKQYLAGIVGEDGELTVTQSLSGVGPATSPRLESSSLVALYTYATTKFLSHDVAEVAEIIGKAQGVAVSEDMVRPSEILKRITLNAAGGVEWVHLFVYQFFEVLGHVPELLSREKFRQTPLTKEKLLAILFRLHKFKPRISFGLLVSNISHDQLRMLQPLLTEGLRTGIIPDLLNQKLRDKRGFEAMLRPILDRKTVAPDMLFVLLIIAFGDAFFTDPELRELMRAAQHRSGDETIISSYTQDSPEKLRTLALMQIPSIFDLAVAAGSEKRRSTEQGVRDPYILGRAIEFCLLQLLEGTGSIESIQIPDKSEFIQAGDRDSSVYFIPPTVSVQLPAGVSARLENGHCSVVLHEQGATRQINRPGASLIGEMAALLGGVPRTATVVAEGQVHAYKLSGEAFTDLLQDPNNVNLLRIEPAFADLHGHLRRRLLEYLLRYLSYETMSSLYDRAPRSTDTNVWKENQHNIQNPEANRLYQWYIPGFFQQLQRALSTANFQRLLSEALEADVHNRSAELLPPAVQDRVLFESGQSSDGYIYIIAKGPKQGPAVRLDNFRANPGVRVELQEGSFFGESALLDKKTRSARATVLKGTKLFKIKAEMFRKLTDLPGVFGKKGAPYKSLLFHMLSVLVYRVGLTVDTTERA